MLNSESSAEKILLGFRKRRRTATVFFELGWCCNQGDSPSTIKRCMCIPRKAEKLLRRMEEALQSTLDLQHIPLRSIVSNTPNTNVTSSTTTIMEKIKAKVEQVLHKDHHNTETTTGAPHTSHTATTTGGAHGGYSEHVSDPTGPHDSRLGNKADPRVDSDRVGGYGNTASTGGHSDPTGPHDSKLMNKLDPRVDSDRAGGYGNTASTGGGYSDPSGPHDSHLANKADPRVDSDRAGGYGNTASAGGAGHMLGAGTHTGTHTGAHAGAHTGTHTGITGGGYSDPTGPHDSRIGNKIDPRVDSDQVGGYGNTASAGGAGHVLGAGSHTGAHTSAHTGAHTGTHTGVTGGGYSDPTGPHDSHLMNKADPRVDSDRVGGYGNTASAGGAGHTVGAGHHHLPGPADNTAGPHKSDLLNKADPRVDSDLDGSKTMGGNRTNAY